MNVFWIVVAEELLSIEKKSKKKKVGEEQVSLQNVKRIDDKVFLGPAMKEMELIIDNRDWDEVITSHREKLELETLERERRIKKMEIKEKSWALYKECKYFLEKNEKNWEKAKIDRELEEKKRERLSLARYKQDQVREKVKIRKLEKEISEGMAKLPMEEKVRLENEDERKRRLEIIETKKNLWRWRSKGKKLETKNEELEKLKKAQEMEERVRVINKILEEIREETERKKLKDMEEEKEKTAEWRKKVRAKDRKEAERKEKLELEKRIANHWAMINWVTDFIKENEEEWDLVRASKIEEANRELETWKKLKRLEKIKLLQNKWNRNNGKTENIVKENVVEETAWTVWRKKENLIKRNTEEVVRTQVETLPESELSPLNTTKVPKLKKPRIFPSSALENNTAGNTKFPKIVSKISPRSPLVENDMIISDPIVSSMARDPQRHTEVISEHPTIISEHSTEQSEHTNSNDESSTNLNNLASIIPKQLQEENLKDPPRNTEVLSEHPEHPDEHFEHTNPILNKIQPPSTDNNVNNGPTTHMDKNLKLQTIEDNLQSKNKDMKTKLKDNPKKKTTEKKIPMKGNTTSTNKPTNRRKKHPVVIEDKTQMKITTMFKPKVNSTSKVCSDVKTQPKLETVRNENEASTNSVCSSSTDVKTSEVTVPAQKIDNLICLNTAGNRCLDLENQETDFTSSEQLSESNFGPNDL